MRIEGISVHSPALSDDELVRCFQASGDAAYFEEIFRRYGKAVFQACLGFHRNAATAEDVTQETFLRAYQGLNQYEGGDLRAWLLRIARNRSIDLWRQKTPEYSYENVALDTLMQGSGRVGSAMHLALLELDRELAVLPAKQRQCLEMKAEGFSYEETAAQLGGSSEEVRSHLQNGRRTLRLRMAGALADLL